MPVSDSRSQTYLNSLFCSVFQFSGSYPKLHRQAFSLHRCFPSVCFNGSEYKSNGKRKNRSAQQEDKNRVANLNRSRCMGERRQCTTEKVAAVALTLIAVVSPLYVDRRPALADIELEDEPTLPTYWRHLLLAFLIVSIFFSSCLDQMLMRSDPYWVHKVGGSSAGIIALLLLLALVLKIKTSMS